MYKAAITVVVYMLSLEIFASPIGNSSARLLPRSDPMGRQIRLPPNQPLGIDEGITYDVFAAIGSSPRPTVTRGFKRGFMAAAEIYLRNLQAINPDHIPASDDTYKLSMHGVSLSFQIPRSLAIAEPRYEVPWTAAIDTLRTVIYNMQHLGPQESLFYTHRDGPHFDSKVRILQGSLTGRLDLDETLEDVD